VFVAFEGGEGSGKSTQLALLATALRADGHAVAVTFEPGATEIGSHLRELVLHNSTPLNPRAEALLFAADRAHHVHTVIRPALARGEVVLTDRYVDSSLAYQGAGRELGVDEVRLLNLFATGGLAPDRTLLLRIDPALGRERASERALAPDRLEREGERFFALIAAAYDLLALEEPARIRPIDAGQAPEDVLADALAAIEDLLQSERAV
jgi:dTMP kinase